MITKLFRLILLMQLILPIASHAQSEAVSNGLNWLKANQAADGSWSSTQSSSTDYYATVSVLDSLAAFGETTSIAYTNGLSWTRNALVEGTTYVAPRVRAVAASGADATTDLNTLLSYYNAGYGWGGDTGHSTSIFHTAVGLQAVKAVSYSDLSISNTALAYLTNSQNADGGWGFSSDNPSNVYVTAITAATLQQFPQSSTIATAITKATTYLTIWQNPDGGFGTSPDGVQSSTVFETALGYMALVGDGQTEGLPLQNALNYLVTTQSANGSWNEDPYSTALALKALHLSENKPAPPPPAATTGSVMGTIVDGATNAPLAGVSAVLAGDTSFTATSDAKGQFALSGIPAGGRQITLSYANYAPLTITAPISAGTFINVGKVGLSATPSTGVVQGIVWDADDNAPYPGVTVQVQSGFYSYDTVSGADGSYRISNIPPGTLTVGTPSGPKAGYWNVPFTGTLAAGGIVIYSPLMSKTPPLTVNMTAQADKTTYKQGETVGLAFALLNTRSLAYEALLNVRVTGPTGTSVYDTSVVVNLTANGTTMQNLSFALPPSAVNGFYMIKAELVDGSGIKKGTTSATFNLFLSQIAVTPLLPDRFASGANTASFDLANTGIYAVSAGALAVSLKDPGGEVISSATLPFTLAPAERKSLVFTLSFPPLKTGDYTISYTQSDETTTGEARVISLPNSIEVAPVFEKSSYQIRDTASLLISLSNKGKFSLDAAVVHVAVPDTGYAETRSVNMGQGQALPLQFTIPLPDILTAGPHTATVTVTLPGDDSVSGTATFTVPEPELVLSLEQTAYSAGAVISPLVANKGGVDSQALCRLTLYDSKMAQIADKSMTGNVPVNGALTVGLAVPVGAMDGGYILVVTLTDLKTGKAEIVQKNLTITGINAALTVQTAKQTYLATEDIAALSNVINSGLELQGGNLHLQVSTATDIQKQKTWTSQFDFQQGIRDGVDSYGVNDWLIMSDDFDNDLIDTNRWVEEKGGVTSQKVGSGVLIQTSGPTVGGYATVSGNAYPLFKGDLDVQVDFNLVNPSYNGESWAIFRIETPDQEFRVERVISQPYGLNVYDAYYWNGSSWSHSPYFSTSDTSGKLRITKNGTTATAYCWANGSWKQLWSTTIWDGSSNVKLWSTNHNYSNYAEVHWDNFKVNSGEIVTKNETVDAIRLLRLNDNFDDGIINNDRWSVSSSGSVSTNEANGSLVTKDTQTGTQSYSNVAGRFPLEGDFDISIDWKTPVAPASGDGGSIFQVSEMDQKTAPDNSLAGNALQIKRAYIDGLGHIYQTSHYNGSTWDSWSSPVTTIDTFGKFRIKRVGSSVTIWYWNSALNRWEWNDDTAGYTWSSAWITSSYVQIGGPNNAPNNPSAETEWNNFKASSGAAYLSQGTIRLKQDAGQTSNWQTIHWSSTEPVGTSIKVRTRTAGNETDLVNAPWSDYVTSGSSITSPKGRWIELEATLTTTNASVTPLLHDVTVTYESSQGDILWQTDTSVNLAQGAVSNLNNTVGAIGAAGKYYLVGTLTSSTGQTVATAEYPFYVVHGNTAVVLNPDRKLYKPGEMVTITGEMRNLADVDATNLSFLLKSTPTGGAQQTLYSGTFTVPAGASHPFTVTATAASEGVVALAGTVTQSGSTLAQISEQYEVAAPKLTAYVAAPVTAGNAPFTLSLTLTNSGKMQGTVTIGKSFSTLSETVTVPAGETRILQYAQQISEDVSFSFTLGGDLNQTLSKSVAYAATPPQSGVSGKIVTDRISYDANQQVTLTSTVTANAIVESLTAWITVANSQGQAVYSATASIPIIIEGQLTTIKKYWDTGINPVGSYLVTLRILDASGAVISTSGCDLAIGSVKASTLLKGRISLDKQSILTGDPVTVSYSVTNTGNTELPDFSLSVQTVNMSEQTVYDSIADRTFLPMGATYTNTGLIETLTYGARDYLVVLRANIAGVEETLAGTYFRVEGAPSAPALNRPASGADVDTLTPILSISNAADPNDDRLSYEFEIYGDSGLTILATSAVVSETAGSTAWTVDAPLSENLTYYWRARAYDGRLYGPWMAPATFRVNSANDPPTAPALSSPADATAVAVLTPTLTINSASDPDSANLTYNFDLALDPDFMQVVASAKGLTGGQGAVSWTVPVSLQENGWYYWRAQADDWLREGPWSTASRFSVNTANDAPSAPMVAAPSSGATVTALATDVVVGNSTDPDSPMLLYNFEADTAPTFDSLNLMRSGNVAEGDGTTAWHVDGLLDNTWYYVRAKASDGAAESSWSSVAQFFANTANDPPATPILANPSNGAGVNLFTPTLSVHNATDPDKDVLTYEFEVYADAAMTDLIAQEGGITETAQVTAWKVPVSLVENQACYWRARAYDGALHSAWTSQASFMVNTANDAPGAAKPYAPAEGSSVSTLTPTLAVVNAVDPDSDNLSYQFEIYSGASLVASAGGIVAETSGVTSWTSDVSLADDTVYQWRTRAFDGDSYGSWTALAAFTVHVPKTSISATIDFDPDTLNRSSKGTWVVTYIELPAGYKAADIEMSSLRLEGTIPAEASPFSIGDHDRDGIPDLMVKFKRSDVINVLPDGDSVAVHVTGNVGITPIEGVDVIRVIH